MSLNSILQIGSSAASAYQTAINVTSENISNVNTPGYSRQTAVLETAPQSSPSGGLFMGNGVGVVSIQRAYDAVLQKELVNAQTSQGYDTTQSTALQAIQPAFNEVSTDGLGAAIDGFFNSWQNVAGDPTSTSARQGVLTSAQNLVDNFNSVSKSLSDAAATQNSSLVALTSNINQNLTNIAQLNGQIKAIGASGGDTNEIKDQRDLAIQNLSQQIGITYTENSDGTTDVKFADNGAALVTGSQAGSFSLTTPGAPASNLYTVNLTPVGGVIGVVSPVSGTLGSTLNLRDTVIPGYQKQVDTLAQTIATAVDTQQKAGSDLTGAAGIALFNPAPPATATGATIAVNSTFTTSNIAAAAGGSPAGSSDNTNALAIADLANNTANPAMPGQTFSNYYNSLVTQVGQDVQTSGNNVTRDQTYSNQLSTLQQSNSGVSLDEELVNLTKYQQSYQASAKVISTATSMIDTVLALIGAPG
ncbi:MAG: flagellar hook-associated protein FlgK [Oryzomonas sp.]